MESKRVYRMKGHSAMTNAAGTYMHQRAACTSEAKATAAQAQFSTNARHCAKKKAAFWKS
jgi:hypothetical protein